ncbi:MAG: GlsB/YeaQ/YmgE family stress response membrane protein [Clostridiales bacterium]|nr:GlsB/YeaQ/YmgE family stress response membrane protein [Clostridiales bacterium]
MGIFLWIVFGALAGWIASILMGRNRRMGFLGNIVVGIIGSALGGWLSSAIFGWGKVTGFNWQSLLIAVAGSCLLLLIFGGIGRKR